MTELIQVVTTVDSKAEGVRLGHLLVEGRLAACVQIVGPVVSIYRWQGVIEEGQEYQLHIKSHAGLLAKLEAVIQANHSYDVPEILTTSLCGCSYSYQQWLLGELSHD